MLKVYNHAVTHSGEVKDLLETLLLGEDFIEIEIAIVRSRDKKIGIVDIALEDYRNIAHLVSLTSAVIQQSP
jgi:hypothetical protein